MASTTFKIDENKTYAEVLSAFLKECKKEHIFFQVLKTMGQKILRCDISNLETVLTHVLYGPTFWKKLKDVMIKEIHNNFKNMHQRHDSYDFVVCCVNTFIIKFVDQQHHLSKSMSCEKFGKNVFIKAAKKILGDDFKLEEPTQKIGEVPNTIPLSEVHKMVEMLVRTNNMEQTTAIRYTLDNLRKQNIKIDYNA